VAVEDLLEVSYDKEDIIPGYSEVGTRRKIGNKRLSLTLIREQLN
jgi:hypothetical protein